MILLPNQGTTVITWSARMGGRGAYYRAEIVFNVLENDHPCIPNGQSERLIALEFLINRPAIMDPGLGRLRQTEGETAGQNRCRISGPTILLDRVDFHAPSFLHFA